MPLCLSSSLCFGCFGVRALVRVGGAAALLAAAVSAGAAQPVPSSLSAPAPAADLANTQSDAQSDAQSEEAQDEAQGVVQAQSFAIRIEAPKDIRDFASRFLELARYQKVPDLDDAEFKRLLEISQANLRQLLGTQGYFTPHITQQMLRPAAGGLPEVRIAIEPGPQTRVAALELDFSGAASQLPGAQPQLADIRARWGLQTGEVFTQDAWSGAKAQALRDLQAQRFPAAQLRASRADIDPDTASARLQLHYASGPLYRYGPLRITGAQRYDAVIAQRLAHVPLAAPYRAYDLQQAQQRLLESGYYNGALVSVETGAGVDPQAAPVLVQLQEAKLQKLVLALGYSTDRAARISIDHTHNRIPALGWRALNSLQADRGLRAASTGLLSPPDARLWRWMLNASVRREDFEDFRQSTQQVRAGRTKSDGGIDRSYYLQYDHSSMRYTGEERDTAQALSANYVWTYRRFNSSLYPTSGYGLALELGAGITLYPKHTPFTRVAARYLGFFSLDGDMAHNLMQALPLPGQLRAVATGDAASANASRPLSDAAASGASVVRKNGELLLRIEGAGVITQSSAVIPGNLLFLSGGNATVRGYGYQQIGVQRADGMIAPGRYLLGASLEYRRPIAVRGKPSDWDSVVFVDAGHVADTPAHISKKLKVGVGAGALWRSPVGPVQLALAYGVADKKLRLHLNLGFSF